jgi:hypothetical protein
VENEEELALEREHDAFPQAPEAYDPPPLELTNRRIDGAKEEGTYQTDSLERATYGSRLEGFDIDRDIG